MRSRVLPRGHAESRFEAAGEVALIDESEGNGNLGGGYLPSQQRTRMLKTQLIQVGVRRQAGT